MAIKENDATFNRRQYKNITEWKTEVEKTYPNAEYTWSRSVCYAEVDSVMVGRYVSPWGEIYWD